MVRKTKEEADKTRLMILETSLNAFYEQGYSGATVVDIAKKIGLTKGAIYWHFDSKVDLFIGLGKYMFERLETTMHGVYDQAETFEELKLTARKVVKLIIKDPQLKKYFTLIFYRMEWRDELLPIKDMFAQQDEQYKQYTQYVFDKQQKQGHIHSDLSAETVTYLWLGFINGFLSRHLKEDNKIEEIETEFNLGADIFINGVKLWPFGKEEK